MTLGDLARTVHFRSNELKGLEPNLEATVHFTNAQPWTFTNGAHLAVVEVDTETGRVSVLRYVAVDDCGRVVNPALVEGQTAGGVAQGLGGALMEHCAYDGAGQPLCGTLMDYAVPTAADVPPLELHHLETPAPSIAGGYKGAGLVDEPGRDGAVRLRPALLKRETVLLYGGPKKRLHHVAFGAPGAEFEATRESLRRAGVSQVDPPRGAPEGGLWVRDPDGNLVNVRPEAGETPPADPPLALNSPGHTPRTGARGCPDRFEARPRRLGHVLLFSGV